MATTTPKPQPQPQPLLLLLPFLLLLSPPTASAHDVTRLLSQFPNFSTFNSLLTSTKLDQEINRRQSITVLAVDNSFASRLASLPSDALRALLSVHVVLDYYDDPKLRLLSRRTTILTTLYQTTGLGANANGFLNLTKLPSGAVAFGSAAPGQPLVAAYVEAVGARPYNLSVLHVSAVIVPPGIADEAVVAGVRSPPLPASYFVGTTATAPPPAVVATPPAVLASPPAVAEKDEAADGPEKAEGPAAKEDESENDAPSPAPSKGLVGDVGDDGEVSGGARRAVAAVGVGLIGLLLAF